MLKKSRFSLTFSGLFYIIMYRVEKNVCVYCTNFTEKSEGGFPWHIIRYSSLIFCTIFLGEEIMEIGETISLAFCIPFVGMLLSIAIFPWSRESGGKGTENIWWSSVPAVSDPICSQIFLWTDERNAAGHCDQLIMCLYHPAVWPVLRRQEYIH